jgi:hypothetical protein
VPSEAVTRHARTDWFKPWLAGRNDGAISQKYTSGVRASVWDDEVDSAIAVHIPKVTEIC